MAVTAFVMAAAAEWTGRAPVLSARANQPADHSIEEPRIIAVMIAPGAVDIDMVDHPDTVDIGIMAGIEADTATAIGSAADIATGATGDMVTGATGGIATATTMAAISITSGHTGRGSRRSHLAS